MDEALNYIYNKNRLLLKLNKKMEELSANLKFEEAMRLRDRIKTIEKSQIQTGMDLATNENIDLFSIKIESNRAVVCKKCSLEMVN